MTQVFAHRGAHRGARENTLEAFEVARALGVDGVELDVRRSLDGVLVVHHDPSAGSHVIGASNAARLPSYVPTLHEALDALVGLRVNVEIKNTTRPEAPLDEESSRLVRQVLDELHALERASSVIVSCFDLATCDLVRAYDPAMSVGWLVEDRALVSALDMAYDHGFNGVHPHFTLVDEATQRRALELGLELNVWTVNATKDLARMVALAVAGVITDKPARALELVAGVSP